MRYLSVCSGIEAASVAWQPLGWTPVAFSEIAPFPSAVLAHHYPTVPNWGDLTKFKDWPDACHCDPRREQPRSSTTGRGLDGDGCHVYAQHAGSAHSGDTAIGGICETCRGTTVDVLVGGTPCQSFSVAGLRAGLADPRGNLALTYLAVVERYRPRWCVWENVVGVLSADDGGALGAFLGGLAELGYGFAYRVLDAQYFGLAQRRKRVFVVGYRGDWRRAAAVLFERACLRGDPAPSRETGKDATGSTGDGLGRCVTAGEEKRRDWETCTLIAHSLRADGCDAGEDGTGRGDKCGPLDTDGHSVGVLAFSAKDYGADAGDLAPTLRAGGHTTSHANGGVMPAIAFAQNQREEVRLMDVAGALASEPGMKQQTYLHTGMQVRRLTPRECERLQGFPDSYTLIPYRNKPAADGPRYMALGNSMAVPVQRWIGQRIQAVEDVS